MSGVVMRLAGGFAPLGALELVVEPVKGWRIVPMGGKMRLSDNCVSHTAHIVKAMPTFSREEIVHLGDLARHRESWEARSNR